MLPIADGWHQLFGDRLQIVMGLSGKTLIDCLVQGIRTFFTGVD
jgi:hypothetical protein